MSPRTRSIGVTIFGVLLCVTSILKLLSFLNYGSYAVMFQDWPKEQVLVRYTFSILLRVFGLVCGIGLLSLKENFRKYSIYLCWFTILTIYWKHPLKTFQHIALYWENTFFGAQNPITDIGSLTYPHFPVISMISNYVIDIVFAVSLIVFFSRDRTKQQFKV